MKPSEPRIHRTPRPATDTGCCLQTTALPKPNSEVSTSFDWDVMLFAALQRTQRTAPDSHSQRRRVNGKHHGKNHPDIPCPPTPLTNPLSFYILLALGRGLPCGSEHVHTHATPREVPMTQPRRPRTAPTKPAPPDTARAAFERLQPELRALPPERLVPVNVDIPTAVSLVLGVAPRLRSFREDIVRMLPHHPIQWLDRLEDIALAAWWVHLHTLSVRQQDTSDDAVQRLVAEATSLRRSLLLAADALADRALIDDTPLQQIRQGQGRIDLANDLVALAALFRTAWDRIEGKTAITREDIDRAAALGMQLLAALGAQRSPSQTEATQAADMRVRAFSLLVHAYDENRRALTYLRWHEDDADDIAPSLFARRATARKNNTPHTPQDNTPDTPSPPPQPPAT